MHFLVRLRMPVYIHFEKCGQKAINLVTSAGVKPPDAAVFRAGLQYAGLNTPAILHLFHNKWELHTQGAWVCLERKRGSRATGRNLEWAGDMK